MTLLLGDVEQLPSAVDGPFEAILAVAAAIADLLRSAGFAEPRTEVLDLAPPTIRVLAVNHGQRDTDVR